MPPLINATTSIKVVTGRLMAKTVGFINHSSRRLSAAPQAARLSRHRWPESTGRAFLRNDLWSTLSINPTSRYRLKAGITVFFKV